MCSLIHWPVLKWAGRRPLNWVGQFKNRPKTLIWTITYLYTAIQVCVFVLYRLKHFMYSLLLLLGQKRFVVLSLVEIVVIHIIQMNKIGQSHCLIHQNLHLITSQYQRLVMHGMNDCPNVEMIYVHVYGYITIMD